MSIEEEIKSQYSKVYQNTDWKAFKVMADYYLSLSAKLMKKDIEISIDYKLMCRNIQKRLYIGIGVELLLKGLFLKNNYCINKMKKGKTPNPNKPIEFKSISNQSDLNPNETYTLNKIIENIDEIIDRENKDIFLKGLKIAKVFRNKEGHIAVFNHSYKTQNYTDIENSIIVIYNLGFSETLNYKIAFSKGEKGKFKIE